MDPLHAHGLLESDRALNRRSVGSVPLCVEDLQCTQKSYTVKVSPGRPALLLAVQVDQVWGEMW